MCKQDSKKQREKQRVKNNYFSLSLFICQELKKIEQLNNYYSTPKIIIIMFN